MKAKSLNPTALSLLLSALVLWAAAVPSLARARPIRDLRPTLILVGIDGCRADYLRKYAPPNLRRLARGGVRARWMIPSFPSKTFPNFYTIATGLYPQHHGIVENNVFDPQFDAVFTMSKREEVQNGRWWLGEPIWATAEKQGQIAATFFYPGTEAEIAGEQPTYWKTYDDEVPNVVRVDTALSWLDLPVESRPTLITLYFSDVDSAGHDFGPDSAENRKALFKVDGEIGRLVRGLRARGIFARVNLIFVSDHGMATADHNDAILLDELFDTELAERILWTYEIVSIFPREGQEDEIYQTLKTCLPPQAKIYRKSELPARFHYSDSPRIAPLLVLPREGWIVTNRKRFAELKEKGDLKHLKGGHGYDNQLPSMRATFIAHGPAFRKGRVVAPFANVHVYNVMARVLGLRPAPNDGNFTAADAVLINRRTGRW